jgi:hypothetical protein
MLAGSLLIASSASARDCDEWTGSLHVGSGVEAPARWAPRHDSRLARLVITSSDGKVDLLLTPTAVAFQISDRKMASLEHKLRDKQDDADDDTPIGDAFKTAVLAGVRVLLKHSAECPVRELRDVDYRDGALVFTTTDGDHLFHGLEVNDSALLGAFSERDARAFVHEFRRMKAAYR